MEPARYNKRWANQFLEKLASITVRAGRSRQTVLFYGKTWHTSIAAASLIYLATGDSATRVAREVTERRRVGRLDKVPEVQLDQVLCQLRLSRPSPLPPPRFPLRKTSKKARSCYQ